MVLVIGSVASNNFRDVFAYEMVIEPEKEAFIWMQTKNNLSSLIISDYSTLTVAPLYINNFNFEFYYKNYYKEQLKSLLLLLSKIQWQESDQKYLQKIKQDYQINDVFILISPRTRYGIYMWEIGNHIDKYRGIPKDHKNYPRFKGESKFKNKEIFQEIYNKDDIQIYRVLLD